MKLIISATKRIEYSHCVEYNGKQYIRDEFVSPQNFRWESTPEGMLEDSHSIKWRFLNDNVNGPLEFYSCDSGWAKDGHCAAGNPVPEIERVFKEGIGKDLIYF